MRYMWNPSPVSPPAPRAVPVAGSRSTVMDGWEMPPAPTEGAQACAYADSDGWYLHWLDDGSSVGDIPWPFVEDRASAADMERAGFMVRR